MDIIFGMTDMRKIQLLLVCLLSILSVQAQTSPQAKERVKEIRKLYAEAKERMAYNDQEEYPAVTNMETTWYYMAPGAGPIKHYIKYYLSTIETDEGEILRQTCYFVSDAYNSGARKIYEEYLLDEETGKLIFAYTYEENGDNTRNEGRYYFNKNGTLAHKDEKLNPEWETFAFANEAYVKQKAANLYKAMQLTTNF